MDFKNADVTLVSKKDNPLLAKKYSPVSVLPTVSKIFEGTMQKQIIDYINQYLFSLVIWIQKRLSTQTALLYFIKKNRSLCLIKKDM